jgi:hypothetical protein
MNKHITYLAVAAIAVSSVPFLSSCRIVKVKKNVETITRRLDLKDFNKIEMNGAYDLEYTQGPYSVTLIIPKEVEDNISVGVTDSLLKVEDTRAKFNTRTRKVTARISAPDLSLLRTSGAVNVDIKNIDVTNLYVESNGAGDIDFTDSRITNGTITINGAGKLDSEKIQGETLTINVNGAGKVDVKGEYEHAFINLAGASFADITELKCADMHTTSSGASKIEK